MQLSVTISEIQSLATNGKVFSEAKAYANDESIGELYFNKEERRLGAKVRSMDHVTVYNVQIWLNLRERPRKVSCTCEAAGKFLGCCKHQVAVMLYALNTRLDRLPNSPEGIQSEDRGQTASSTLQGKPDTTGKQASSTAKKGQAKTSTSPTVPPEAMTTPKQTSSDARGQIKNHRQTLEMMRRLQTVLAIDRGSMYRHNPFAEEDDPDAATGDRPRRGVLRQLDLEMTLQLPQYSSEMAILEGRIGIQGESRYYKIKSFEELIDAIDNGKSLVFGKELTLHPDRQYFNQASQAVIDWLIFLYHNQTEKTAFQYQAVSTLFRKNQVMLNAARLYQFIELYANEAEGLDLTIEPHQGKQISAVIRRGWPKVAFALRAWPLDERLVGSGSESDTRLTMANRLRPREHQIDLSKSVSSEALNILELLMVQLPDADDEEVELEEEAQKEDIKDVHSKPYPIVRAFMANSYKRSHTEVPLRLLTKDASLIFFDGEIWMTPTKDRAIASLYRSLASVEDSRLLLGTEEAGVFMSQMLPVLEAGDHIRLGNEIESALLREPLHTTVWLDKEGNGVSARIEFRYGDYVVDPHPAAGSGPMYQKPIVKDAELSDNTDTKDLDSTQHRWQLRDENRELQILDYLQLAGFTAFLPAKSRSPRRSGLLAELASSIPAEVKAVTEEDKKSFYLFGDKKLYTFLSLVLPELQNLAEIFYSDRFQQIKIRPMESLSMRAGLQTSSDLLAIEIDGLDYSPEDLSRILSAYREKRQYVRLKDGEFLSLDYEVDNPSMDILAEAESWGGTWDGKTYTLPKYRAVPLQQLLAQEQGLEIDIDSDLTELTKNLEDPSRLHFELPAALKDTLRPYQAAGFYWLCLMDYYGFGGILADDMGLGKTLQALTYMTYKKQKRIEAGLDPIPCLIVAPTSLIYNWQDEAKKFTPDLKVMVVEGTKDARMQTLEGMADVDLVIMSYTVMRQDIDVLKEGHFAASFLDEAQYIKNPRTLTAKAVKQLTSDRRFALTGTPIENSLSELWSIFDFLMPGYLFSHNRFYELFEQPISKAEGAEVEASEQLRHLVKPFILRRMKKNVLTELPDKIESIMRCDMTEEQQKIYYAYVSQARDSFESLVETQGFERSQIQILALLTRLRQISCHPSLFLENYEGGSGKLDALEEHIDNLLSSSHRILLFSQFTSMLSIIRERQEKLGREVFYIDGQIPARDRLEQVDRFNNGEGEIFLISLRAGGTGLNLTGADTVIHYDPWWNPAVEQQATDRAHRIGQREVVQIFRMVSRGTIEEKILQLQEQKSLLVEQVIMPGENFLKQMSMGEIRDLLSYEV